jgi:hypothetical protein
MSLGWGDGGFEGDMGLEPDGPPSPHPSNRPLQEQFDKNHGAGMGPCEAASE